MTATETQIYEDYLDYVVEIFRKEIGDDPNALAITRGRALNPHYDKDESEKFKKGLEAALNE